jgi:hypothetical protein
MPQSFKPKDSEQLEVPRDPLTGTWGAERMRSLMKESADSSFYSTTNKDTYNDRLFLEEKAKMTTNSFAKFTNSKKSNALMLKASNEQRDLAVTENPLAADLKHSISASSNNNILTRAKSSKILLRTEKSFLRTDEAPYAIGRSGPRMEKGISPSGLLGEQLNLTENSSRNSLCQRSWLYCEDPAVNYKINGVPKAYMPNDVSLNIGNFNEFESYKAGKHYGRKAVLTGDPLSKAGSRRAGVFMDEFPAN